MAIRVCQARGCGRTLTQSLEALCRLHWFMVPGAIRQRLRDLRLQSPAWFVVLREAVDALAALEGTVTILYSCELGGPDAKRDRA
jgi:hypothetical protein